jgi:hypothetical protein
LMDLAGRPATGTLNDDHHCRAHRRRLCPGIRGSIR